MLGASWKDQTTALIGENKTGKTAVLEAIRIRLDRLRGRGRRLFDDYDYHLADADASPRDAEPNSSKPALGSSLSSPCRRP